MTEQGAQRLAGELERRFQGHVEAEEVSPGRFRLAVVSPRFAGLSPLRRQDEVWAAIDSLVDRESTLDVSLVLAYAPDEIEVAPHAEVP